MTTKENPVLSIIATRLCYVAQSPMVRALPGTQAATTRESRKSTDLPTKIGCSELVTELRQVAKGVVDKTRELRLKRTLALKVILAGTHAADSDRKRFQTEADSAARLTHQNVVQVYEVGESDGHHFLALEYGSGGSWSDRLKENTSHAPRSRSVCRLSI